MLGQKQPDYHDVCIPIKAPRDNFDKWQLWKIFNGPHVLPTLSAKISGGQ